MQEGGPGAGWFEFSAFVLENGLACPRLAKHPLDLASALWLVEGGRASRWLEEPLLSIVLVEVLCEDGLLLCSKVSLSLLFKHASYKGIFTWHIPLETGRREYHPFNNRTLGPLENKVSNKQTNNEQLYIILTSLPGFALWVLSMPRISSFRVRDILDLPRPMEKCCT